MNVELNISPKDHSAFREQMAALPETILFANLLAQTLATSPYIMQEQFKASSLYDANFSALTATYQLIEQYQLDKMKEKRHGLLTKKVDEKKARVFPEKVDNIQVYESKNDDKNITLENGTQLFLAVEIKDAEGIILQKYPNNAFSSNIVEAGTLFFTSKKHFKQPQGKHSIAKVLTPGFDNRSNPNSITQEFNNIRTGLILRSVIENMLYPIFNILKIPTTTISEIIFNSTSPIFSAVAVILAGENPRVIDVISAVTNELIDDFLDAGPIAMELTERYGDSILKTISKELASFLAPYVGQIKMVYRIVEAIPSVAAMKDIAATDPQIDFNIQFPVTIKSAHPKQLLENELSNNINIDGNGFRPVIDEENGEKVYPEVYLRDSEGVIKIIEVNENNIKDNGKKVIIKLPDEFKKPTTKFPLDLAIRHPTTNPNPDFPIVENAIVLISGFQITGIDRDESLVLNGYCNRPQCGGALNEASSSAAYLNWTGFNPSSSTHSVMFLNRKLKVCKIPTTKSQLGRVCYDSARTSYDRTGERLLPEQFIQPEGSIAAVFKTYPVSVFSSQNIKMPYRCPYVIIDRVDHDPNKKYRVDWEIFLEKREFNSDSGLFEPVDRTQTVNFAFDCHYY